MPSQDRQLHVVPPGQRLQLRHGPRPGVDQVSRLTLAKEGRLQGQLTVRPQPWAAGPEAAQQTAFGQGDQQTALGHVVG